MKPAISLFFAAGSKRWSIFFLLLVLHLSQPVASQAQNYSVQVNNYLKTQVKETTIRGVILVAENMTDWLSQTNTAPVNLRKTDARNLTVPRANAVVAKQKCPAVSKTVKRP